MSFRERKLARSEYYERFIKGWKERNCSACNGSGYYDSENSPPCSSCNGTGKEKYEPVKSS